MRRAKMRFQFTALGMWLLCTTGPALATDYCPIYSYGQFNNTFYYYGQQKMAAGSNCNGQPWYGLSDTTSHTLDTDCVTCLNVISRFDKVKEDKDRKDYKAKPAKGSKINDYAKRSTSLGSDYTLSPGEKIYTTIISDAEVVVDKNKKNRYFRVLELLLTIPNLPNDIMRIGHEIDPNTNPTTMTTYVIQPPDPEEKDTTFHHIIKNPDDSREFYVYSKGPMEKK
jgi:hypothetical protein